MPGIVPLRSCASRSLLPAFVPALLMLIAASFPGCNRHPDPQAALNHAESALQRGDIRRAQEEAEQGYKNFRTDGTEWAWKFTILRARVLHWQGADEEALGLLNSEPLPPSSGELAVKRLRLEGLLDAALLRFSAAEQRFSEAERLCTSTPQPSCVEIAGARGVLEMKRGRYSEAQSLFARALGSARTRGDAFQEANALLDLSWSADEQAHFDESLDWSESLQKISLERDFADYAEAALGNMGWAYYKLGDPEKARGMFDEAGRRAAKLGDRADQVKWITNAAYTYMDAGQFPVAEQSFLQSLALAQQINSREDIVNSLIALAFVSEQSNKLDDAARYADQALAMARADGNGRDVVYPLLVKGRIAADTHDTADAEEDFRAVAKSPDTPVFLKWEAERSLARLFEDEHQFGTADKQYRTALTTFEAARCGLHERVDSRLPFLSNAARVYEDYIHFLVSRGQSNDALRVADYTRARTLAEGLGRTCKPVFAPDPLNAEEIARRGGGSILFYELGQEHSYLWAITPLAVKMFPLAANRAELDAAVTRYRKKLEGPREILEASNDGSTLYQMLVAPADSFLKQALKKNSNVFVVPDGALNSLNFETLMPQANRYWIEDVTLANAASLRLVPEARAGAGKGKLSGKLLLVGDPVTADTGHDNAYPELPNAGAQMQTIERYFPDERQTVCKREHASRAAYLGNHPEQFSYIHFVAHGMASRTSPLDSAIILSKDGGNGTASQDESFKLYARDIIATPRLRADLVTISACYSTGNRTYSGEGLVGLSWAFLRAGAHNVVAALWDVSDASTPQLIDRFYAELKKGSSPGVALRQAKLSLLHGSVFRSPFYWGPFQLYTGS